MSRGAAPSRADLVRALALRGPEAMAETAELLGFRRLPGRRRRPVTPVPERPAEIGADPTDKTAPMVSVPRVEEPPLPMTFWRPVARSYRRPDEPGSGAVQLEKTYDQDMLADDLLSDGEVRLPVEAPVVGWPRLWRALDEALRSDVPHHAVDVDGFVEQTARGEVLFELPRRSSRELGDTVLVIDRSPRLELFWRDKASLHDALKRKLGPASITVMSVTAPKQIFEEPRPGRQWMVVGDLGLYGDGQIRRAWGAWAARTKRRLGHPPLALIPCPRRGWHGAHLGNWQALDWSAPNRSTGRAMAKGSRDELQTQALDTLLCLASVAMRLETGLLRDLRLLVPGAGLDTEIEIRRHPAVLSSGRLGLSLDPSAVRPLRRRFMDLPEPIQRSTIEALRAWHEESLPEVWMTEMIGLLGEGLSPDFFDEQSMSRSLKLLTGINAVVARPSSQGDALEVDTDSFLWRLGQWGSEGIWTHPESRESFERGFRALKARYPESAYPVGVTPDMMVDRSANLPIRKVKIHQVGAALRARDVEAVPGSFWCELSFREPEVVVSFGKSQPVIWRPDDGGLALADSSERCSFVTDVERVDLEPWAEPDWATASGRDQFGLWASFELGGVEQRMRWIPPGRFLMGSPEAEDGRFDWEGPQHEVVLTEGFWLAETPCVQELWRAVMGDDPSHFKGDRRPVEQVSWKDCQTFLDRLNFEFREFEFELPTEAEWEYACRAGTDTPTWLGTESANLERIAWYRSNSDGQTHEVAEKAPNPLGLYDVLGNVWEWCWDWQGDYSPDSTVDPEGPEQGSDRVFRGGAWGSQARSVRAAYRGWNDPGYRSRNLGFRLSRGQGRGARQREGKDSGGLRGTRSKPRSRRTRAWVDRLGWASDGGTDRFGRWASFQLGGVEHRLRWIYPGTFQMGSPENEEGRWDDEGPRHKVTLTQGYWLAETPCTQDLWTAVMGENPSYFQSPRRPVEQVSWEDCQEFFQRLQERDSGLTFHLPTEAQWEYACRAGTTAATWRGDLEILGEYHAEILDSIAWYGGNSGKNFDLESESGGTRIVSTKAPNSWGLYDMLGNVDEWCADWNGDYSEEDKVDPTGPTKGSFRVIRGGAWLNQARDVRAAYRYWNDPGHRDHALGFRLSRGPSGGAQERSGPGARVASRSADEGRGGGETGKPLSRFFGNLFGGKDED